MKTRSDRPSTTRWLDADKRLLIGKYKGRTLKSLGDAGTRYARWILNEVTSIHPDDRAAIQEFYNWSQGLIDDAAQDGYE